MLILPGCFKHDKISLTFKTGAREGHETVPVRVTNTAPALQRALTPPSSATSPRFRPSSNGSPTSPIRKPAASVRTTVDEFITFACPARTR
jgi:hypothetical protein